MAIQVVTGFPVSPQAAIRVMAYDPLLVVYDWLPYLGMAIIDTSDEYAAAMSNSGYQILKASRSKPELLITEIEPGTVHAAVDGSEILSLLGVDKFHNLGIKGSGVKIAVIDTGVRATHLGLRGRVIEQFDYTGVGIGHIHPPSPMNTFTHGTNVAGCIVADFVADGKKILGVAPDALLGDFKVWRDMRGDESEEDYFALMTLNILRAMNDAVGRNYLILNCSFGDVVALRDGINWTELPIGVAAERLSGLGILVVASAGNRGPNSGSIECPASVPSVIAVGGMDAGYNVLDAITFNLIRKFRPWTTWEQSGRGPTLQGEIKPDICAICSMFGVLNARTDSSYETVNGGTSFASPQVAGIAALVFQSIGRVDAQYFRDTLSNRAIHP